MDGLTDRWTGETDEWIGNVTKRKEKSEGENERRRDKIISRTISVATERRHDDFRRATQANMAF